MTFLTIFRRTTHRWRSFTNEPTKPSVDHDEGDGASIFVLTFFFPRRIQIQLGRALASLERSKNDEWFDGLGAAGLVVAAKGLTSEAQQELEELKVT